MTDNKNDTAIAIRMTKKNKEYLFKMAEEKGRSASSYLREMIKEEYEKNENTMLIGLRVSKRAKEFLIKQARFKRITVCEYLRQIIAENYSEHEKEIEKIWGGNTMRVLRQVEQLAEKS